MKNKILDIYNKKEIVNKDFEFAKDFEFNIQRISISNMSSLIQKKKKKKR